VYRRRLQEESPEGVPDPEEDENHRGHDHGDQADHRAEARSVAIHLRASWHVDAGTGASMEARAVFLGDWGRVVRDPIDLLRVTFFAGAAVFAVLGELGGVANLLVAGVALLVARAADLPRLYDLAFTVAMFLTGWGEALGLYDAWKPYDNVVHFIVPMLTSQVAYIALARLEVLPDMREEFSPRHYTGLWLVTFALGVAIGGLWEILEWGSDGLFGSNLSMSNDDTVGDLIADSLGAAAGGLLLIAWTKYGWGSVRRVEGTNLAEDPDA
jgi:hypothetical protein